MPVRERGTTSKEVVDVQLAKRELEYTDLVHLTVFCGTWNVNGKKPPESLEQWLCVNKTAPDIYAVGFQEMDLTGQALLLGDTAKAAPWEELIAKNISTIDTYVLINSKQLVGMFLCLFIKSNYYKYVSDVKCSAAGCGLMNKMGNKGAVGIRFKLYDSKFCFINSHLSAHQDNVPRRNQDYNEICRRLVFGEEPSVQTMFDHEILFWIGDLNYRLEKDDATTRMMIEEDLQELLKYDQLSIEQTKKTAFEDFFEPPINFKPTYKYDTNSNNYDTSEKHRVPAWCDRILWLSDYIEDLGYYRRHELLTSDHRPVSNFLKVTAKNVNVEMKRSVTRDIIRKIDQAENDCIPQCIFDKCFVDLGNVPIDVAITKKVTITNSSAKHATIKFYFVPKPNSSILCKPWLNIEPECGLLAPTESIEIKFTVLIEYDVARLLNLNKDKLSDIVIVRLENGIDHYIEIAGNFQYSCLGNSLENLIRHPKPIRENKPLALDCNQLLSIPKEIWKLIDYLRKNAIDEPDLFQLHGSELEICNIIEILDTGKSIDEFRGSNHSVAVALLRFFSLLEDSVIPSNLYQSCMDASDSVRQSIIVTLSFKTVNYNVFYYTMAFLRDCLLKNSEINQLTAQKLAQKFCGVFVRPSEDWNFAKQQKICTFLINFLKNS